MGSLINIPNQPIQIDPPTYDGCDFVAERCLIIHGDDPTNYSQFKLSPCNECITPEINLTSVNWIVDPNNTLKYCANNTTDNINFTAPSAGDFNSFGNYFYLKFTITNYIQGTIRLIFGSNILQDVTANGTYEYWVNGDLAVSNWIELYPWSGTFEGCVEVHCVDAYYIPTDVSDWIEIRDIKTDTIQTQVPIGVNKYKNHVIISWSAGLLNPDCYYIKIADPCELWNIYQSPIYSVDFTSGESWVTANDCTYAGCNYPLDVNSLDTFCASSSGDLTMAVIRPAGTIANKIEQSWELTGVGLGTPASDCCYRFAVRLGTISFHPLTTFRKITIANGKSGNCLFESTAIVQLENTIINFDCCEAIDEIYIRYELDYPSMGIAFQESICFESIKIYELCNSQVGLFYNTNCFQILPSNTNDGTSLIVGESLANSYQLGFYFVFAFKLIQRLSVKTLAPKYPIDANTYIFSDGSKKITSAQREKRYEMIFQELTELQHDTLSAQILTKEFSIDGKIYLVEPEDYQPNWNVKYGYPMADVRVEAMEQGTIIFKSNEN